METLCTREQPVVTTDMISTRSPTKSKPRKRKRVKSSYIAEFRPTNKKKISKDKSRSCERNTQGTKSSKTSHPDSTTKEKASKGFWDSSCAMRSKLLPLPNGIGSVDLDMTFVPSSARHLVLPSSWTVHQLKPIHQKKWSKTSCPLSTFFPQRCVVKEDTQALLDAIFKREEKEKPTILEMKAIIKEEKNNTLSDRQVHFQYKKQILATRFAARQPIIRASQSPLQVSKLQVKILKSWIKTTNQLQNQIIWFLRNFDPAFRFLVQGKDSTSEPTQVAKKRLSFIQGNDKFRKQWVSTKWTCGKKKYFYRDLFTVHKNLRSMGIAIPKCPMKVSADAVMRLLSNVSGLLTRLQKNQALRQKKPWIRKYKFKMHFRQTHQIRDGIICIDAGIYKFCGDEVLSFKELGGMRFQCSPSVKRSAKVGQICIKLERNKFCLRIPYQTYVSKTKHNFREQLTTVALDPGCRKFLTYFDCFGNVGIIGNRAYRPLRSLIVTASNAVRRIRSEKKRWKQKKRIYRKLGAFKTAKRKHRLRVLKLAKRYRKCMNRTQNITKDAHYKISHWLLKKYDHVILPKLNVSFMAKRKSGLGCRTRTSMIQLRHAAFRRRLIETSTLYGGQKVYCGGEAYTSMTCSSCGTLNRKLGASETFKCATCLYCSDRDVNAARNILLLYTKPKK
jgi:transposase